MLKVDASLDHIPARREHVLALFESINQPLVNIPGYGAAPTSAHVLGTRNDQGHYMVFVYLAQRETRAAVVYVSEPRSVRPDLYRVEEGEALRFVESMGFMMDSLHFPTLPPHEQEALIARVPLFRPPERGYPALGLEPARAPQPFALDPGGARGSYDALFGGLSAQDGEVLRRLESGRPQPAMEPRGAVGYPSGEVSRAQVLPPARGGSAVFAGLQGTHLPASALSAVPGAASRVPGIGAADPLPAEPRGARPAPDTLARLGRLLGSFGVLLALALGGAACLAGGSGASSGALESHVDLGNQQLAQGQFREAVATFAVVLADQPRNRDALRGTGLAYMSLERAGEAERYYREALEVDPAWSIARNELAVVLTATGRCADAVPLLEAVLGDIFYATPEFAEHNLARALACLGRAAESVERLRRLVERRPRFCLGYLTLAEIANRGGHPEVSLEACDGFTARCEEDPSIGPLVSADHRAQCQLQRGLAHVALGDVESARSALRRCEASGTFGAECRRSLARLPD